MIDLEKKYSKLPDDIITPLNLLQGPTPTPSPTTPDSENDDSKSHKMISVDDDKIFKNHSIFSKGVRESVSGFEFYS